jgi:hypothetical protein
MITKEDFQAEEPVPIRSIVQSYYGNRHQNLYLSFIQRLDVKEFLISIILKYLSLQILISKKG